MVDLSFRFDLWYRRLPKSPSDVGRIAGLVVRTGPGQRATPESVQVTLEHGVVGDAWRQHEHALPGNQVSMINVHVLRSVAADQDAAPELSGDNLQVDLDLSEANLPVGTLLTIGEAVLEVSPEPHRPCRSFHTRFGATAAKKIARANRQGHRGRGVLLVVRAPGTLRVGDPIYVKRPGTACLS